ncbi:tRNA dihydrouridine synthase [Aureococcus anophagefferens]|nr:tRNA dihydrouridine synthase [Aureococcus anophagefferens]
MIHAGVSQCPQRGRGYLARHFQTGDGDWPLVAQFAGADDAGLAVRGRAERDPTNNVVALDLNLGCPQQIARRPLRGVLLEDDVDAARRSAGFERLLRRDRRVVTCKRRARVPPADVVAIANGGIGCRGDVDRVLDATGCDAAMSSEGLENPALRANADPDDGSHVGQRRLARYLALAAATGAHVNDARAHVFKLRTAASTRFPRSAAPRAEDLAGVAAVVDELDARDPRGPRCRHHAPGFDEAASTTFADREEFNEMKASGRLMFGQVPARGLAPGEGGDAAEPVRAVLRFIGKLKPELAAAVEANNGEVIPRHLATLAKHVEAGGTGAAAPPSAAFARGLAAQHSAILRLTRAAKTVMGGKKNTSLDGEACKIGRSAAEGCCGVCGAANVLVAAGMGHEACVAAWLDAGASVEFGGRKKIERPLHGLR